MPGTVFIMTPILALPAIFAATIMMAAASASAEPPDIGRWGFEDGECVDPITITQDSLTDTVDLQCQVLTRELHGQEVTLSADCGGSITDFRFAISEDGMTMLEGIDFGSGIPVELYRCSAQ